MTFGSGSGWWNDISLKLNCVLAGRPVRLCFYRLFAFLDLTAVRRGGLMHWGRGCVIDTQVTLQALCICGLNRCSAGRSDALRAWVCHRHAGDLRHYICSVVCCKNRVCRLAFASCCGW